MKNSTLRKTTGQTSRWQNSTSLPAMATSSASSTYKTVRKPTSKNIGSPAPRHQRALRPANAEPYGRRDAGCRPAEQAQSTSHPARLKPLDRDSGVSGMVRTAAWLDNRLGVEVLNIGRSATGPEDCALELCGSQLLVRVTIQGGWLWVNACSLDQGEAPELLFNVGDGHQGWTDVRRFVMALERSGIRSLEERPIHIGNETGPDSWLIA